MLVVLTAILRLSSGVECVCQLEIRNALRYCKYALLLQGRTALHVAAGLGYCNVVQVHLMAGAQLNIQADNVRLLCHVAVDMFFSNPDMQQ